MVCNKRSSDYVILLKYIHSSRLFGSPTIYFLEVGARLCAVPPQFWESLRPSCVFAPYSSWPFPSSLDSFQSQTSLLCPTNVYKSFFLLQHPQDDLQEWLSPFSTGLSLNPSLSFCEGPKRPSSRVKIKHYASLNLSITSTCILLHKIDHFQAQN